MSPYQFLPLVPLGIALSRMLENIEAELADKKLRAEEERLCHRAELIRGLLTPSRIT
jgi:hypothetical protein